VIEWWTPQQAGLIGGFAGSAVGVIGGGLGALMGVFAPKGMFRGLFVGSQTVLSLAGVCALIVGGYANLAGQPYHVYFPLMLLGSITAGVLGGLVPLTLWAYRLGAARRESGTPLAQAEVRAPTPAMVRAIADAWSIGGPLRVLSLRIGAAMLGLALVACAAGVIAAARGLPIGSWGAWLMAAIGPATAALICWALPRTQLNVAASARTVLDQQRLAAEELRRT
jgi:hypothetical protein